MVILCVSPHSPVSAIGLGRVTLSVCGVDKGKLGEQLVQDSELSRCEFQGLQLGFQVAIKGQNALAPSEELGLQWEVKE